MIRKMKRVYLFYTRNRQDKLVRRLQELGILHIEETRLAGESGQPAAVGLAETRQEVEGLLIKARGILELFREVDPKLLKVKARREEYPLRLEELARTFRGELEGLEERLRALVSERREIKERLAAGERFREVVRASEELLKGLPIEGRELVATLGEAPEKLLEEIEATFHDHIPGRFTLASRALTEGRLEVVVSVEPDYAEAVREYLEAKGLRPLVLPTHVGEDFQEGIAQLRAEETTLPRRLEEIEGELREIAVAHLDRLVPLTAALENRLSQLEAASRFGYTDFTLLITGWIPQDEFPRFQKTLSEEFPGIVIEEDPQPARAEEIPVEIANPPLMQPYKIFLEIMGLPKYGTVDPTPFVSLFFPVFFGMIVGDIGYGLVMLGLFLWAKRRFGHRHELVRHGFTIGMHAAVMSIVFGIIFGEVFGFPMAWPHLSRYHYEEFAQPFLLFTIALGAVHVILGFVIGAINAVREKSRKHLTAKVGAILLLLMLGMLVGTIAGVLPEELRTPGIALLVVALFMLLYGEGFIGLLEVFTYVGHVISYARLMGFGMAAVVLAKLANDAAGAAGNILLGVLIAVVLHAMHLVLDVFESTIQSARLHLVEFFQKFYEMGGKRYEPFRERAVVREE
jgi:V/A-type H+-transporting ATPase subunit I